MESSLAELQQTRGAAARRRLPSALLSGCPRLVIKTAFFFFLSSSSFSVSLLETRFEPQAAGADRLRGLTRPRHLLGLCSQTGSRCITARLQGSSVQRVNLMMDTLFHSALGSDTTSTSSPGGTPSGKK